MRIRTSLSIGVVAYPADGRTADDLMIAADQAMYMSKRRGKNRIVGYGGAWRRHPSGSPPVAGSRADRPAAARGTRRPGRPAGRDPPGSPPRSV